MYHIYYSPEYLQKIIQYNVLKLLYANNYNLSIFVQITSFLFATQKQSHYVSKATILCLDAPICLKHVSHESSFFNEKMANTFYKPTKPVILYNYLSWLTNFYLNSDPIQT